MRKVKLFSIALLILPLLNTGCMQEKASTVKPSIQKSITKESKDLNQSSKPENNSTATIHQESNELEALALSVQSDELEKLALAVQYEMESDGIQGGIIEMSSRIEDTTSSSIGDNWVEMSKEEEIILTAQEFMGAKYVWAANGPECFDCSGFTRYVYKEHGMTLPRYSGHQAKVGIKVEYNELQVGDLVFFDTEKKYRKKVNHVGIYVGNDKFIHASSAKKRVVITSFKKKRFYKNRFLWGQRVVSNNAYASL
ncbi:C40 family peptidase [Sulfurovum sp. bin170]|uniref:C40 family peptidase n=1 Tax=Sulfurovum sp. bin170 TaxID=2695268 RepID=UPI0013DF19C6|nr:C40 family peptidase [Sulfurovum sp. bin170]NEW60623.1 C40 family peptidase [Sulfurovum sp. bin170]